MAVNTTSTGKSRVGLSAQDPAGWQFRALAVALAVTLALFAIVAVAVPEAEVAVSRTIPALNPVATPEMNAALWYAPSESGAYAPGSISAQNPAANPGMDVALWYAPSSAGQAGAEPQPLCGAETVPCP